MQPLPALGVWPLVFLISAVQGLFVAFVLIRWKRGHRQGNRLLALLLLLFAVTMLEYILYWTNSLLQYPHACNVSLQLPFLFGPVLWWYFLSIYENRVLRLRDAWHLAIFAIAIAFFVPFYALDTTSKIQAIQGKIHFPVFPWAVSGTQWGRIAHMLLYAAWNYWYIRKQPSVGATTRWAILLNSFFLGFALAYLSYFVLVQFPFFNLNWDYHISLVMTTFIYLIAYAGYVQPAVFEGFAWTEPAALVKYKNSGLTPEASRSLLHSLDTLMSGEKRYRDPELNLETLGLQLNATKHHVSQIINEYKGVSFFEYINHLRIEEARQLLAETTRSDLHVIEVAYAVGFNNKVSFNTAFKKATGMTPTEYRRNHAKTDPSNDQPASAWR